MNKPFQSGMGVSRALRSLVAFAVLFLAVGISQSFAQSYAANNQTILTNKQVVQAQAPTGTNFVSGPVAISQLKAAGDVLQNTTPQSAAEEVEIGATLAYFEVVVESISSGSGVGDAYNTSAQQLTDILSRFQSSIAPSFAAVRQTTLALVSQ